MDTDCQAVSIEDLIQATVLDAIGDTQTEHDEKTKDTLSALAEQPVGGSIDLWRPYTAAEVADFLSLSRSRIYDIPEDELMPTRLGPGRGSKRFLGINLLCYITGLEPVDVEAVARKQREAFLHQARKPVVRTTGKRRVC